MLGFLPRKLSYYRLAFLPKSASVGQNHKLLVNNERLEFLGDAILDAIVADYLFRDFRMETKVLCQIACTDRKAQETWTSWVKN